MGLILFLTPTNTNMTTDITTTTTQSITAFSNAASFESAQRMALALVSSNIVPEQYRGKDNIGNAIVALEMAQRIGASPLAVMQNLNIIHGRPSWSSTFIIAALNSCGRFAPVRFEVTGEGARDNEDLEAFDRLPKLPAALDPLTPRAPRRAPRPRPWCSPL